MNRASSKKRKADAAVTRSTTKAKAASKKAAVSKAALAQPVAIPMEPIADAIEPLTDVSSGGCINISDSTINPLPVSSISDDISLNVTTATREKIVKGEYVDLATLLNRAPPSTHSKLVLVNGSLTTEPIHQLQRINSIELWTDAFLVFSYIYCTAHPERFREMLKYMHTIRLGAKRTGAVGWKTYDEQYRLRKAQNPASSWGVVDHELWLLYMHASTPPFATQGINQAKHLKCYTFNYTGHCLKSPCIYIHSCLRCGGNHSVLTCSRPQEHFMFSTGNMSRFSRSTSPSSIQYLSPGVRPFRPFQPKIPNFFPRNRFGGASGQRHNTY